jgi:aspartyl-tRNA(Asn)/glutamyl-tRNA(Gln) amidotransferase subunit B
MQYEAVIGLEVHAQLATESKIFSSSSTKFGNPPNSQVNPVCLGMPGVLPVFNERVLEYAIKAGLATNCEIARKSRFARKNYFYPDLPKGYQVSQYDEPLCLRGHLEIDSGNGKKKIRITRIHLEEDAGKLVHEYSDFESHVDLNRAGVPLVEIVSEPDISTAEEAVEYVKKLRTILRYIEVCDGNMEEGSLRCDANVSVRPVGQSELGTKTEIKNLNSFRFIQRAIEYEIKRQEAVLQSGGKVVQETRLFDSQKGVTFAMRSKEEAHDYRYFPDPDLLPVVVEEDHLEEVRLSLPELPDEKLRRFVDEFSLPKNDAETLSSSKPLAEYFEECAKHANDNKTASNWILNELLREVENEDGIAEFPVKPGDLAELLNLIGEGKINRKTAKEIFSEMISGGKRAGEIVAEKGLTQITDEGEISSIIEKIIKENPKEVERYKAGDTKLLGFFVGQVMKATKGKANPAVVNQTLRKSLEEG